MSRNVLKKRLARGRERPWLRWLLWSHVIGVVGFYLVLWWRTAFRPDPKPSNEAGPVRALQSWPRVSIILPARNEEANIRRCVSSLLEQDYPNYELIVVDDGSTDGTVAILDELARTHAHRDKLYVLQLRDELPSGWAGKPHAIQMGTGEASGDWLLFTDADTWHAPGALSWSVTEAERNKSDLFSMGSYQELTDFWSRVMMPMAYIGIAMQYPPRQVNDPYSNVAIANGQYILLRSSVYQAIGGYARPELRATLLDDRDLARLIKQLGYRLRFVDGREFVHVRMYQGLGEAWRGWRKNVFLGSRGGVPFVLLMLVGLPMVSIAPFLLPLLGRLRIGGAWGQREVTLATGLELSALLSYRLWVNREMDLPAYNVITHPLAGALFEGILAQSTWRILTRKGVDWRGRIYHDGASK